MFVIALLNMTRVPVLIWLALMLGTTLLMPDNVNGAVTNVVSIVVRRPVGRLRPRGLDFQHVGGASIVAPPQSLLNERAQAPADEQQAALRRAGIGDDGISALVGSREPLSYWAQADGR